MPAQAVLLPAWPPPEPLPDPVALAEAAAQESARRRLRAKALAVRAGEEVACAVITGGHGCAVVGRSWSQATGPACRWAWP